MSRFKKIKVYKPWGKFEQFTLNEPTTVKILTIKPDAGLSYQSHTKRDEFWRCIKNNVMVILDDTEYILNEDQDIFIPKGAKHRLVGLERKGKVLEISFGEFDEEDIVRYEDDFGREGTTNMEGTR